MCQVLKLLGWAAQCVGVPWGVLRRRLSAVAVNGERQAAVLFLETRQEVLVRSWERGS